MKRRILIFLGVFGPATIAALADNDAAGVATFSVAGATLGYPILFILAIVTPLLAVTQEMGIRLALVTRKGLGDLIREEFGVKVSLLLFIGLCIANMGTIIVDLAAVKTTSSLLSIPAVPAIIALTVISFLFVTKGNFKVNQNIMLTVSLFFLSYVFSAVQAKPDWAMAFSNLFYPHGVRADAEYVRNYFIIGLGVLGTTVTPWGQFFIGSFAFDKKIETDRLRYSQIETYAGALLTSFFSASMIVATAATLFSRGIPLLSGEQAALAMQPFAGELAGTLFAVGILNAGFMGVVIVALSTAYAFTEFFGVAGSLDATFTKSRVFYLTFLIQILVAGIIVLLPFVSLFRLVIITQFANALLLPVILHYLLKLTSDPSIMGSRVNNAFQRRFTVGAMILISLSSVLAIIFTLAK